MKRMIIIVFVLLIMIGCADIRHAKYGVMEDGTVSHYDRNLSVLAPPIGPEEMARSKLIDSQANFNNTMARMMETGAVNQSLQKTNFKIAFTNLDLAKDAYIFNPEFPSQQIPLTRQGGSFILPQSTLPTRIDIYHLNKIVKSVYPIQDFQTYGYSNGGNAYKKLFNNQEVDLVYTIARIY